MTLLEAGGTRDYFGRGATWKFGLFDPALANGEGEHVVFPTREAAQTYAGAVGLPASEVYVR